MERFSWKKATLKHWKEKWESFAQICVKDKWPCFHELQSWLLMKFFICSNIWNLIKAVNAHHFSLKFVYKGRTAAAKSIWLSPVWNCLHQLKKGRSRSLQPPVHNSPATEVSFLAISDFPAWMQKVKEVNVKITGVRPMN